MPPGGRREGSGRPRGSGTGRTTESRSVSMPLTTWRMLDEMRGSTSRGVWLGCRVWSMWNSKASTDNSSNLPPPSAP